MSGFGSNSSRLGVGQGDQDLLHQSIGIVGFGKTIGCGTDVVQRETRRIFRLKGPRLAAAVEERVTTLFSPFCAKSPDP
jgi:hypothetical protein